MKIFIKIIIIIFFSNNAYTLDIDESIKNLIENNIKIKIAKEKIIESRELILFAKGNKLPSIESSISGKYSNSDTSTSTARTTPETFTDSYKLTIKQNIYDSGINNIEIERSKILFDNELIEFKETIQNLILEAISGYLSVIKFEKSLEATNKNYESLLRVYEETKTRYDLGSATLYELQNSEASVANAKTNLFESELNVKISKRNFKSIVGLEPTNLEEVFSVKDAFNLEDILNSGFKDNLSLSLIKNNIEEGKILILKEKRYKKPKLDLEGVGIYSNGSRLEKGSENTSGSISMTLSIPIYQKGHKNSNIRKLQSQLLQSEMKYEDSKNDLKILTSNIYKDFEINRLRMKSNTVIIKSIKTALNSLKAEFDMGTKTISDLVDEEKKLLDANVDYLNSQNDYLLNYFKLKSIEGNLIMMFDNYLPDIN